MRKKIFLLMSVISVVMLSGKPEMMYAREIESNNLENEEVVNRKNESNNLENEEVVNHKNGDSDSNLQVTPSGIEYDELEDRLDQFVKEYEAGLASVEISVFDRDGVFLTKNYGFSDIENQVLADETTVYEWGSCSKLLVWVSVMQQVELGKIDLNADIRDYLPEHFLTKLQYENEKITMINLMNHNAGFQESYYENQLCDESGIYDNLEEALKACDCYQAYHVGEYTAYSNYGTALAAFVVECVSGEDYRSYVKEHIFAPLGMEHTSIDPHMNDNEYVKQERETLKCYSRYEDKNYNDDYGVCYTWVQLYPAGSTIGTIEDFAKFGRALVDENSPLFQDNHTYSLLYAPTSYFGDSDIAKNCHGLWTSECKIQILGHGGNTGGCSSMLKFDPCSGLGVVVMTNEPGETFFNYGIPTLLFGEITDREEYSLDGIKDTSDISGIYFSQRSIDTGAASYLKYVGSLFPIQKNDHGSYDIAFGPFIVDEDAKLFKIAEHQYVLDRNGMKEFLYYGKTSDGKYKLEMMSQDIITSKVDNAKLCLFFSVIFLGLLSIAILFFKLLVFLIKKIKKKTVVFDKSILFIQGIYAGSVLVILASLSVTFGNTYWLTVISSIIATIFGLLSLANGVLLLYRAIKKFSDKNRETKKRTLWNQCMWGLFSILYFVFMITFQVYQFDML